MTSILSSLVARLREPSTYAGLSALALAVANALSQSGTARDAALVGAAVSGAVAVVRSETTSKLATSLQAAAPLLPALAPLAEAVLGSQKAQAPAATTATAAPAASA
jgi:hypothetical protein